MDGKDVICEITEYWPSVQQFVSAEYTEINGSQVGKYVSWNNGQKTSEGIFEEGELKSGKWTFWGGSGGKDTYEIIYKNDREWDGTKVKWHDYRRREEITYKEGRLRIFSTMITCRKVKK